MQALRCPSKVGPKVYSTCLQLGPKQPKKDMAVDPTHLWCSFALEASALAWANKLCNSSLLLPEVGSSWTAWQLENEKMEIFMQFWRFFDGFSGGCFFLWMSLWIRCFSCQESGGWNANFATTDRSNFLFLGSHPKRLRVNTWPPTILAFLAALRLTWSWVSLSSCPCEKSGYSIWITTNQMISKLWYQHLFQLCVGKKYLVQKMKTTTRLGLTVCPYVTTAAPAMRAKRCGCLLGSSHSPNSSSVRT